MPIDFNAIIATLKEHLVAREFVAADAMIDATINSLDQGTALINQEHRTKLLGALRSARQFEMMGRLAQALLRAGHDDPQNPEFDPHVRRQYAQSLIEAEQTSAAIDVLRTGNALIATVPADKYPEHDKERREILGLLGRATKQIYMNAQAARTPAPDAGSLIAKSLQSSMHWYGAAYVGQTHIGGHWPLINMIAVAARAERDGLPRPFAQTSQQLAHEAIAILKPEAESQTPQNKGDQPWLRASLGEASVAIQDWPQAMRWYAEYAAEPYVDAFQLASAKRQLIEVWQINPNSDGDDGKLVRLLDLALATKPGGSLRLSPAMIMRVENEAGLLNQAILGTDAVYKINWLLKGFKRSRAVAGVYDEYMDRAYGTAFLVEGQLLHPSFGSEPLAITAAHVVSRDSECLTASAAILRFDQHRGSTKKYAVEEIYSSPMGELDFCVLRLKNPSTDLETSPIRDFDTVCDDIDALAKAHRQCSTIGHTNGEDLAVSLGNSQLIDLGHKRADRLQHNFLRYTTSTHGGNSGGPVYDQHWNVLGMHRAGIKPEWLERGIPRLRGRLNREGKPETHVANEGVTLKSIAAEFRAHWSSPPVAIAIPTAATSKWQQLESAITSPETSQAAIEALFEDMQERDFPTDVSTGTATAAVPANGANDDLTAERSGYSEQFYYGAAVALSEAFRKRRNNRFVAAKKRDAAALSFVSEGDSWFQFPDPRIRDVIDHLSDSYPIYCRAIAGLTFNQIFADTRELMAAIRDHKPNGVLLSGGGNDLLGNGEVTLYVKDYNADLPAQAHLTEQLDQRIKFLIGLLEALIAKALLIDPQLRFFVHGYDRAIPRTGGKWLGIPLRLERNISSIRVQREIVGAIVDRYNEALAMMARKNADHIHYIDCRGVVGQKQHDWRDELHPRSPGFGGVAGEFHRAIRRVYKDHPSIRRNIRNLNG